MPRKSPRLTEPEQAKKTSARARARSVAVPRRSPGTSSTLANCGSGGSSESVLDPKAPNWEDEAAAETEAGSATDALEANNDEPLDGQPETLRQLAPAPKEPLSSVLRRSMDAVGAKVDAVMTAVQALETRTDNKMEQLDSSLAETTSKLINQALQLDRLDADVRTISNFDGTLDEVKDEVLTLQRDTDSNIIGRVVHQTKLDEKFKGVCDLAAAEETKLNRLDHKVDVLQVSVTQTKDKVHAMELSVHQKLDRLMGRVEELIAFHKAIPVAVQEP